MRNDFSYNKTNALEAFNNILYALVLTFSFKSFENHNIVSVQFFLAFTFIIITIENYFTNYQYFTEISDIRFDESILLFNFLHLVFAYKCLDVLKSTDINALKTPALWISAILIYANSILHSLRTKQQPFVKLTLLRLFVIAFIILGWALFNGKLAIPSKPIYYLIYSSIALFLSICILVPRAFGRGLEIFYGDALIMKKYNSIKEIPSEYWLLSENINNPFLNRSYLLAIENGNVLSWQYQYFVFLKDGTPICIMAGIVIDNDFIMFAGDAIRNAMAKIRKLFPKFLKYKTLEIGPPLGMGNSISMAGEITESQIYTIILTLKNFSRMNSIKMMLFRDFRGEIGPFEIHLKKLKFKKVMNMPSTELNVQWKSINEFLADFRSRYRYDIKKKRRILKKHNVSIEFDNNEPSDIEIGSYVKLYEEVVKRSSQNTREYIGKDYHRSMASHLKENSFWLKYMIEGKIIAYTHFIIINNILVSQFIGMDYDESHKSMVYFNSYYDQIDFAIKNGLDKIEAGITAYEAKSSYGFSIIPMRMYAWLDNRLILYILALAFGSLTNYDVGNYRQVFKDKRKQKIWDGK